MKWSPIATAPKDGTKILVWRPHEDHNNVAHAGVDFWKINHYGNGEWYRSRRHQQPTHWMPLPPPPK